MVFADTPRLIFADVAYIDTRGLSLAISKALEWGDRTPAQAVNTAGLEIAIGAQARMPFSTVGRIDAELDVIANPVIGKRGKPLKKKKWYSGGAATSNRYAIKTGQPVPLAVLILQASVMSPNKTLTGAKYNLLTNFRYARDASPFKGVSRETGRMLMRAAVHRMISSRHSSIKFLLSSWTPVIQILRPYSSNKWRFKGGNPFILAGRIDDKGGAEPAQEGVNPATCVIHADLGQRGRNAESIERAMQTYGAPALQAAIDDEGVKQLTYYFKKSGDEELLAEWNRAAK